MPGILFTFYLLTSSYGSLLSGNSDCEGVVTKASAQEYQLSFGAAKRKVGALPVENLHILHLFPDAKNDLFIGADSGFSSMYLATRNSRLRGGALFGINPSQRSRSRTKSEALSPGLIIRIKDIPLEKFERLEQALGKSKAGLSCATTACSVMRTMGYKLGGINFEILPRRFFKRLLSNGMTDQEGRPVEFEVYYLGNIDGLENRVNAIPHDELYQYALYLGVVPIGLTSVVLRLMGHF